MTTLRAGPFFTLLLAACAAACEAAPRTASTQTYGGKAHGVTFSYPGDWENSDESPGYIELEPKNGPEHAVMLIIHVDAESNSDTLESMADDMKLDNAANVTTRAIPAAVKASKRGGLERRFDYQADGGSFPHIKQFHRVDGAERVAFLIAQAPADEWDVVKPGFQIIYDTFQILP
jgi:hypothetical protein